MHTKHLLWGSWLVCGLSACSLTDTPLPADNALLNGTIEGLSQAEQKMFLAGDVAFNDVFFTSENGLGPRFVATGCASCHAGDGKGHPSTALTRFGQSDATGNHYLLQGGPQLQHRALPGYAPEALPSDAPKTVLLAPAVAGVGFLEFVSDADLLAMADPNDDDGDGISGRVHWNRVPSYVEIRANAISNNGLYITRFGKKGAVYDLVQQTSGAYNQDIGITSVFEPKDSYTGLNTDPEISEQTIREVVFYLQALKAPTPRQPEHPDFIAGKQLFIRIGCESCHRQMLQTGAAPIAALANKPFYPYTDLLLHDMGAELNDGYTEGNAEPAEWRTPALWGLGLSPDAQGGAYYLMHDGRATSIEQAILLHGGEGNASREAYRQLSDSEKAQVIHFLESL